jgi:hypothetical protein
MYDMDHLLTLLTVEKAKELQFRAGSPPVIVSDSDEQPLQGPPITSDDVMRFFTQPATSRDMRALRESGMVRFEAPFTGLTPRVNERAEEANTKRGMADGRWQGEARASSRGTRIVHADQKCHPQKP